MKKRLSHKVFITSQLFILIMALTFLGAMYYILNIQYQRSSLYSPDSGPVTMAPASLRLDLEQPDNDVLSYQASTLIKGTTLPNTDILIYSDSQDMVIKSKADGTFSTVFNLDEEVNKITVAVFDKTGDQKTADRTVYYSKEKLDQ